MNAETLTIRFNLKWVAIALAAVCLALGAVIVVGHGGSSSSAPASTPVTNTSVAHAIQNSIAQQRHMTSTVSCPQLPATVGAKFTCLAHTHKYGTTKFIATVQQNGKISYVGI